MGFSVPVYGWQPLSDTGAIMPGCKAYFYRTGTTTPKDTYTVKALTVGQENANPVVADAYGRFGAIFLKKDEGYRCVLKTSADVTVRTEDEVFATSLAVDEQTRRKSISASPRDYGCVGDGSTNDYTNLAAAMAAATEINGEGLTYRSDTGIDCRSGMTLRNMTLDFSNGTYTYGVGATGALGNAVAVSSAVTGGQTITPNSVAGLAAGDLIMLYSSDTIATGHEYAELFVIEQVSGGNVLVDGIILGTYTTSPNIVKITPVSDVLLEDVTIIAPTGGMSVLAQYARRFRMRNVKIKSNAAAECVRIISVYDAALEKCALRASSTAEAGGIEILDAARDVLLDGCRVERSLNPLVIGDDYSVYGGLARGVRVVNSVFEWCGGAVIAEGGRYVKIEHSDFFGDMSPSTSTTSGILIGGVDVAVRYCTIRDADGSASREGIDVNVGAGGDIIIEGNHIVTSRAALGVGEGVHVSFAGTGSVNNLKIIGNTIEGQGNAYIEYAGGTIINFDVSRNICRGGTGVTPAIDLTAAASSVTNWTVNDNTIDCDDNYTHGIRFDPGNGTYVQVDISGNKIYCTGAGTQAGILFDAQVGGYLTMARNIITGNGATNGGPGTGITTSSASLGATIGPGNTIELARGSGATACIVASGSFLKIIGNTLVSNGSVGKGIAMTANGASHLTIANNEIRTDDDCIEIKTSTGTLQYTTIIGNNCLLTSASAGAHVIEMDDSGGSTINYTTITGNILARNADDGTNVELIVDAGITLNANVVINGTYGFNINAGASEAMHDGNVFTGQATGTTNGTFDTTGDSA